MKIDIFGLIFMQENAHGNDVAHEDENGSGIETIFLPHRHDASAPDMKHEKSLTSNTFDEKHLS
jgi:hypothetical protein